MIKFSLFHGCKDSSIYANQSMWYYINKLKEENHNDNLNRCRKAFEKIQHPLMLKTLQKMGLEGTYLNISSIQFSCSVVFDSLRPYELQHTRPPCPSLTPGVHSNSCPSSQWCHPDISSSVVPFSSCPQSLPASGSFPMSQLLAWGGKSIGVSALASVLPMNTQDWSPLGWTDWTSLPQHSKGHIW